MPFLCLTADFWHLKNLNGVRPAIIMNTLARAENLNLVPVFKLKVLIITIFEIKMKALLRRFTIFIKEIQSKKEHFDAYFRRY